MHTLPPFTLFDLDDTLFDHARASRIALETVHASHANDLDFDEFATEHARVLETYHARFLNGEFTLDQARTARMIELFATFEKSIDGGVALDISTAYRREHQGNRTLVPGARELLDALQHQTRMGIITNNSVAEQIEKLRALDIAHFFEVIVISEEVGVTKPDPRIFDIALKRLGAAPHDAVMIGDSFINDVQGAARAGIAPIWLDRTYIETRAVAGLVEHKRPAKLANIGVLKNKLITIAALDPLALTLAAIEDAYLSHRNNQSHADFYAQDSTHKENNNAGMETLAS
jgi:HAD superfamily hydrolase (TIGR01549 family)